MQMREIMNVVTEASSNADDPIGNAVTDVTKAKAGDVLDTGQGTRYRFILLSRSPTPERGYWRISGRRWIASRNSFAQSGISFLIDDDIGD